MTEVCVCVGQNVRPLNKREYILDIATEAEPVDTNYSLWFRRVIWSMALKLDNELYVTMHYNQVEIYCYLKDGCPDPAVAQSSDSSGSYCAYCVAGFTTNHTITRRYSRCYFYSPHCRVAAPCSPHEPRVDQFYVLHFSTLWVSAGELLPLLKHAFV